MPLKIPLTYDSEKVEKFGKLLLKIGKVILYLALIWMIIFSGYKYYITKDIFFAFMVGFLIGILLRLLFNVYRRYKKER